MKKIDLLSLPFFKDYIDPNSYNKDEIVSTVISNYKNNKPTNIGYWDEEKYSTLYQGELQNEVNLKQLEPIYRSLIEQMISKFKVHGEKVNYTFDIANCTCSQKEEAMRLHEHTMHGDFALVHYISYDEKHHTPTQFLNTHTFGQYVESIRPNLYNLLSSDNLDNIWMQREFFIDMKEDEILIVPSVVPHWVPPQPKSDKHRIIIATNITLQLG